MNKIKLLPSFLCFFVCFLQAQTIITTVAGIGTAGYTGDGSSANLCKLNYPSGIVFDPSGSMYIADDVNNCIRKVNISGIITTVAGNGTAGFSGDGGLATSAQLNGPGHVAFDALGNMFIADCINNRIRKVNTSGIISTIAGNGTPAYSGDGGTSILASLNYPWGITFDTSGNLYIADIQNNCIRKVNTSGTITTVAGNGIQGYSGDGGLATSGELSTPYGIAFDASGNLYISDLGNNVIRKVNSFGIISTFAGNGTLGYGGDGGIATLATLNFPAYVLFDGINNMYIADYYNHRIRKVNNSGIITTIVGNGVAGYSGDGGSPISAQLNGPYSFAFNMSGNLYIADSKNHRIRMVNLGINTNIKENPENNYLTIFPNPCKDKLYINHQKQSVQSIKISDIFGNEILKVAETDVIDIALLQPGIYFLHLALDNSVLIKKIIKQ